MAASTISHVLIVCNVRNIAIESFQLPIILGADSREGNTIGSNGLRMYLRFYRLAADLMSMIWDGRQHHISRPNRM